MQRPILLLAGTALIAGALVFSMRPQATKAAQPTAAAPAEETLKVDPPARQALFGDLHLHTSYSFDAWGIYPSRLTPDDAYHFAAGEPVNFLGKMVRRDHPLDFLAVTDHAEYQGVLNQLDDPNSPLAKSDATKAFREDHAMAWTAVNRAIHDHGPTPDLNVANAVRDSWARSVAAANSNYRPGRFTTFIAYEWTSMPGGEVNMHRNVIFAGNSAPQPFTSMDSDRPEDLWTFLERVRRAGSDVIAIPHNSNASGGLMFDWVDSDRHPISEAYALRRTSNEPLVEIYQTKGQSETHPELSPADEFANFEKWDKLLVANKPSEPHGSYVRDALGRGLVIQGRVGANPYKLGFVGASDIHNGLSASSETASNGNASFDPNVNPPSKAEVEALFAPKHSTDGKKIEVSVTPTTFGSAGLTGVWAEENNRPSIFAALRRRETFATSGTRMRLRFFGSWGYPQDLLKQTSWPAEAYRGGVPMGSDLPAAPAAGRAPTFILWAVKDPDDANLDRIQVVKVWLDKGEYREKVFDVAWSGARRPDPKTGKLPAVGNTVDLKTAHYTNSIGTAALQRVWRDPEFDPSKPAVYYARALQIPTPRWSTYLAARYGLPLPTDVPATIQERGWSSPIWYTPTAKGRIAFR
jgi:hypothetical protein